MDRERFDAMTRLLAASPSRRAALAALFGAGALGAAESVAGEGKNRGRKRNRNKDRKRRKSGRAGAAGLTAEAADCLNPGSGQNLDGCNYTNADFSDADLHGSSLRGTIFQGAILAAAKLHGSNARGANFRGANLCGADLSSSTLRQADFRDANLTLADLSSSACAGTQFNAGTVFCGTIDCNGNVRNDDCPDGPGNACCGCAAGQCCVGGTCAAGTSWSQCGADGQPCQACATGEVCAADSRACEACAGQPGLPACEATETPSLQCGDGCRCATRFGSPGSFCAGFLLCFSGGSPICANDADCLRLGDGLTTCVVAGDFGGCAQCTGGVVCARPCPANARRAAADSGRPWLEVVDAID